MELSAAWVQSLAPDTFANAQKLAMSNAALSDLHIHQTILSGQCAGNGNKIYRLWVDFSNSAMPLSKCSCPSRKKPCKHALALLLAYIYTPHHFTTSATPPEYFTPRKPSKKTALRTDNNKKMVQQLDGITQALTLLEAMAKQGLASIDGKSLSHYTAQIRLLGDFYIPGIQQSLLTMLDNLLIIDTEIMHVTLHENVSRLHAALCRCQRYLQDRLQGKARDTASDIESFIGTAWQLSELKTFGLTMTDAKLIQLAFTVYDNEPLLRYEDIGLWLSLNDGIIYTTRHVRPYTAGTHLHAEDSIETILTIPTLYRYPSENLNPRIRWESAPHAQLPTTDVWSTIMSHAQSDWKSALHTARKQLINPLCHNACYILLTFDALGHVDGNLAIRQNESCITLHSPLYDGFPPTIPTLTALGSQPKSCMLVQITCRNHTLQIAPISLITRTGLIHLQ